MLKSAAALAPLALATAVPLIHALVYHANTLLIRPLNAGHCLIVRGGSD